ncbi:hypothetical protein E2C01_011659 [Portunus trituberculatus]|uniref:Integrase p58-like C-terminal domain-containing protein n=1 Tax=Portunus trituberculatus TaxID=210409 RepID=A0A5B7DCF7_PORTR|nr:hypothetical protein [Portunus trituberculatus]
MLRDLWQSSWNMQNDNKLHAIKPTILPWPLSTHRNRRWETALARLRLGHTGLTHGHLLPREPPLVCPRCHCALSVSHIFLDCPDTYPHRRDAAVGGTESVFGCRGGAKGQEATSGNEKGSLTEAAEPLGGAIHCLEKVSEVTFRIRRGQRGKPNIIHADRLWRYHGPGKFTWGQAPCDSSSEEEDAALAIVA